MRFMKLIRRMDVQVRLLAALLGVSIIPAVLIALYSNRTYTNLYTAELSGFAEQNAGQLSTELGNELQRFEMLINTVSVSPEVQELLAAGLGGLEMRREVERIIQRGGHFRDIFVLDADGNILYATGYIRITGDNIDALLPGADASSPEGSLGRISTPQGDFLTLGRKIFRFPLGQEHIGYIFIIIDGDMSDELLAESTVFDYSDAMLLMSDGTLLAGSETAYGRTLAGSALYDQLLATDEDGKASFTYTLDEVPSLVAFSKSERYGTYLLTITPLLHINEGAAIVGLQLVILAAATIVICIALSIIIYRSVASDWKEMTAQRDDDQRRKRELELDALHYQINPHFLFNTLGTLKWSAVMNNDSPVIINGITSLSRLLQGVLLNKDEMITLREELDNLKHYFTIQEIRYENSFKASIEVDEDILDYLVPRLILQPLAENSVLHGTAGSEHQITITIRGARTEGGVLLEIADNGSGFDTQTLKDKKEARFSRIGLSNVDERLKLHFGQEHGLNIVSVIGEGTTCRVFIPDNDGDK